MEFWGVEVKNGEPLKVKPGLGFVVHLSQASLGELKKDNKGSESVCLYVNVNHTKLVLGTLHSDKLPQQQFDLIFDRDFELSHNKKSGSVYFFGYKATNLFEDEDDHQVEEDDSDSDEDLTPADSGKPEGKSKEVEKSNAAMNSASGKKKAKIAEEDDSSDDDEMSEEGEEYSDSDESDDSDEETPKKAETSKKRPAGSAAKTRLPEKKSKSATPQKTGGSHVATPHPAKRAGKTPANKNQHTPKSGGAYHCKPCNRSFGSENALESHSKAKHSAGK